MNDNRAYDSYDQFVFNGVEMFEKSGINRICDNITEFQQHS